MEEDLKPTPLFYKAEDGTERVKIYYYTKEREVGEVDRKVERNHRRYYAKQYAEFLAEGDKATA